MSTPAASSRLRGWGSADEIDESLIVVAPQRVRSSGGRFERYDPAARRASPRISSSSAAADRVIRFASEGGRLHNCRSRAAEVDKRWQSSASAASGDGV